MPNRALVESDVHWREYAQCIGEECFFPASEYDFAAVRAARAICAGCPVQVECLSYAMETNQPDGIWGGMSARERQELRRHLLKSIPRAS